MFSLTITELKGEMMSKAFAIRRFFSSISDLTQIAKPGYVIKGLNVFVGESDPVIKEPAEYPDWMLKVLQEPTSKQLIGQECTSTDPEERQEFFKRQEKALRKKKIIENNQALKNRK